MHILHITPYYAPAFAFGGVVSAVHQLCQTLTAHGQRITVLTTDALTQTERYSGAMDTTSDNIRVVRARNASVRLRGSLNLSTPFGLPRLLNSLLHDVDVVHVHEFRTLENLLALGVLPAEMPVVLSPHGTLGYATGRGGLKQYWDKWLSPRLARRITHVAALTQYEQDEATALWRDFGLTPQVSIIPNGVTLPDPAAPKTDFRQKYGIAPDTPLVLFMGRLHARKGIEPLVRAFQQANVPDARLALVGPDEGMLPIITPLLDERIILTGYLGGADKIGALAAANIFALPATGEGLSMALLEALGAGLPAVIAPGCNMPEVADVGAGYVVEPQVDPLADALRTLLTDANQRHTMGAAARRLVTERFTWNGVAAHMIALYERLTHRP